MAVNRGRRATEIPLGAENSEFDYVSLEKYLNYQLNGERQIADKVHAMRMKNAQKIVEQQRQEEMAAVEKVIQLENVLRNHGLQLSNADRKKYLTEFEEQRNIAEKKQLIEYWSMYSTSALKARQSEEAAIEKRFDLESKVFTNRNTLISKETELMKASKAYRDAQASGDAKAIEKAKKDLDAAKQGEKGARETYLKSEKELENEKAADAFKDVFKENFSDLLKQVEGGKEESSKVWAKDIVNTLKGLGRQVMEGLNKINQSISTYADYQLAINTRLQGATDFSVVVDTLSDVAFSPLINASELYANLSALVSEGISSNIEQRAFLQTVKNGIATTFDANDSTLRRLIRLQQYDSTAARLGLESSLTAFMNELVRNTEYLNSTFDSVASSLLEASSLLTAQQSAEFEYIVQKWLGVLSGVGLSDTTTTSISQAIGYLGSGNISALSGMDIQNLLIMAAGRNPNIQYATMLAEGLTAETTNELLKSVVEYLKELGTSGNNIVKSELAKTFGVSVSDIQAAKNVETNTLNIVYKTFLTYNGMYEQLTDEMRTLAEREGISKILENLFGNFTFQTGMNLASNPVTYATWKITDLIQSVTGGINIPAISAAGFGVDLETTVENLVKLGLVGISTLGGIGDIVSGMKTLGSEGAAGMLAQLGIAATSPTNIIKRGEGLSPAGSGETLSQSMLVTTSAGEDYSEAALSSAEGAAKEKLAQESETQESQDPTKKLVTALEDIDFYNKFESIASNVDSINERLKGTISVRLEGLTGSILGLT